jgi:hypothetical protein
LLGPRNPHLSSGFKHALGGNLKVEIIRERFVDQLNESRILENRRPLVVTCRLRSGDGPNVRSHCTPKIIWCSKDLISVPGAHRCRYVADRRRFSDHMFVIWIRKI